MLVVSLGLRRLLHWITLDYFSLERQERGFFSLELPGLPCSYSVSLHLSGTSLTPTSPSTAQAILKAWVQS